MGVDKSLDALRREIDAIDDLLYETLVKRIEIGKKVRKIKGKRSTYFRPGREAEVFRRLVSKHASSFPEIVLVRIWCEILAANVGLQGPFSVSVYDGGNGYRELARDHYGSATPFTEHPTAGRVIDSVAKGKTTLGVLPFPQPDDEEPWWPHLLSSSGDAPKIVARLPFVTSGARSAQSREALVLCRVGQEKTGDDRSFIVIDAEEEISLPRLRSAIKGAGLPFLSLYEQTTASRGSPWLALAEIDSFVSEDDSRLETFMTEARTSFPAIRRTVVLGGYAVPVKLPAKRRV